MAELNDEVLTKLLKSSETTELAFGAVAEILQKMNARLEKADDEDEEEKRRKEEEKEEELEKARYNAIAKAVFAMVKEESKSQGMPVDSSDVKNASPKTVLNERSSGDNAEPIKPDTKTENVQATIQASDGDDDDKDRDDKDKDDKDGADEYPMEEMKGKDMEKALLKELQKMRSEIAELKKSRDTDIQKAVKDLTEKEMLKKGFRQEKSTSPRTTSPRPMGTTETMLRKSSNKTEELLDTLADMPYQDLRRLQIGIENGEIDGIPEHLIRG